MKRPTKGIAVDCACSGNPGKAKYRGILLQTGEIIFSYEIKGLCTNNIAEFVALVHGVDYKIKNNIIGKVYSDSTTALAWYRKKKHNSKMIKNLDTACAWTLLEHAVFKIPAIDSASLIDFWNNEKYGETPADYGNKKARSKHWL